MRVTIDTDDLEPDAKGEVLRNLVFVQKINQWGYKDLGCYSTFEVSKEYKKINPDIYPALYRRINHRSGEVDAYENGDIVVMWAWDGDGALLIWIKGEKNAYYNGDCKCTYGWIEIDLSSVILT